MHEATDRTTRHLTTSTGAIRHVYAPPEPLFVCPFSGSRSTASGVLENTGPTANSHGYGCGLSPVVSHEKGTPWEPPPPPAGSTVRFKGVVESARGHKLFLFFESHIQKKTRPAKPRPTLVFLVKKKQGWKKKTRSESNLSFFWWKKKTRSDKTLVFFGKKKQGQTKPYFFQTKPCFFQTKKKQGQA